MPCLASVTQHILVPVTGYLFRDALVTELPFKMAPTVVLGFGLRETGRWFCAEQLLICGAKNSFNPSASIASFIFWV